jgi:protocadherin beta
MLISVVVLDIQNTASEFERPVCEVQIPENSTADGLVIKVSATDLDAGTNENSSFSHISREVQKTYEILPVSGKVHLKGYVDF